MPPILHLSGRMVLNTEPVDGLVFTPAILCAWAVARTGPDGLLFLDDVFPGIRALMFRNALLLLFVFPWVPPKPTRPGIRLAA